MLLLKAKHSASFLVLVLLLSSLGGCGWHLRGSNNVALQLPPVYLKVQSASKALQRELTRTLKSSQVSLVESRDQAQLILTIVNENTGRRVLSVDSAGRVQEYELQYALKFFVNDAKGEQLIAPEVINRQRDYIFDSADVLAKDKEQTQLFDMMRSQAIQTLMRRLQSLSARGETSNAG